MLLQLTINVQLLVAGMKSAIKDQRGATATEYGILLSFLALALVLGVTAFGQALNLHYVGMTTTLKTALGIP